MRKTGAFFAPTRFIRILTAIKVCVMWRRKPRTSTANLKVFSKKEREIRLAFPRMHALFWGKISGMEWAKGMESVEKPAAFGVNTPPNRAAHWMVMIWEPEGVFVKES